MKLGNLLVLHMFAGLLFPWVQVCSRCVSVCRAPSTALWVVILLFAKPVCVCILKLLGHQALIWASRIIVGHLALKAECLPCCFSPGGTRESHSCLGCVWGGWVPGIRAPCARCSQPSARLSSTPRGQWPRGSSGAGLCSWESSACLLKVGIIK